MSDRTFGSQFPRPRMQEIGGDGSDIGAPGARVDTRLERYSAALRRIRDESPHIENHSGVCPACMAEVALGAE